MKQRCQVPADCCGQSFRSCSAQTSPYIYNRWVPYTRQESPRGMPSSSPHRYFFPNHNRGRADLLPLPSSRHTRHCGWLPSAWHGFLSHPFRCACRGVSPCCPFVHSESGFRFGPYVRGHPSSPWSSKRHRDKAQKSWPSVRADGNIPLPHDMNRRQFLPVLLQPLASGSHRADKSCRRSAAYRWGPPRHPATDRGQQARTPTCRSC